MSPPIKSKTAKQSGGSASSSDNVLLGRQPIIGRDKEVFAYELLYRDAETKQRTAGHVATSRVLIHSLINIGLDSVVGLYPAFINATEQLLEGDEIELLPANRVVFEILETIKPTPALAQRLRELTELGYRFALDDFIYHRSWDAIVDLVDFIKLDVLARPVRSESELKPLRRDGLMLLAEKVETYDEFSRYVDLGFDLFQGYFFCRPETLSGKAPAANKITAIRVLGALSDPSVDSAKLAKLISEDATLCFQLLRLSNSAAMSRNRAVETIEDAVVRVGTDSIRHWVSLLLLTQMPNRKPHELLFTAMSRARMCELMAQRDGSLTSGASFVAGLLSAADALLDRPYPELIASMPLTDQLREALLEHKNEVGKRLSQVLSYEEMLAGGGTFRPEHQRLEGLRSIYFDALRWAQQLETRVSE